MRKQRKSFIKKTLEVYYSQSINKLNSSILQKKENKIERKIKIKLGNGSRKYLRYKHFDNSEVPIEWGLYKNKEFQHKFLPKFLFGSILKNGSYIYFLKDTPKKRKIKKINKKYINNIVNLQQFLFKQFSDELKKTTYSKDFVNFLLENKEEKLIHFLENKNNTKNQFLKELSYNYNNKSLCITKDNIKIMNLNSLKSHFIGYSFWSIINNFDTKKAISINDFFDQYQQKEQILLNEKKSYIKLSFYEYIFNNNLKNLKDYNINNHV